MGLTKALSGAAAGILIAACLIGHASAQADFYKGKTVSLMVGFPPGGGYDVYARVVARHLPRHIPGTPNVIVQNMPGAGSLNLANHLYSVAPKDGTIIGSVESGAPFEAIFEGKGVRFDPFKFTWIGGLNKEVTTCVVWHTSPVKTLDDLRNREAPFAGTGPGAPPEVELKLINDVLGTRMKLISGYRGLGDVYAALERGEIEGSCGINVSSVAAVRPTWFKEGKLVPLVQMTTARHPDLPAVPLITELARDDEGRQILGLLNLPNLVGRPYVAPPDLPAERTKLLRDAFSATMRDEAFLAEAKKASLPIDPVQGKQIETILSETRTLPKAVTSRMVRARM
jgi:tripartite-type tricarboxylate transporter receptor subunit TctC